MADEGVFATTAEILRHAGSGASTASSAEAFTNQYVAEAESLINVLSGVNWSDLYSGLDADLRDLLKLAASVKAAISVIKYDIRGYASAREAENLININWQSFNLCVKILLIHGRTKFLGAT